MEVTATVVETFQVRRPKGGWGDLIALNENPSPQFRARLLASADIRRVRKTTINPHRGGHR